MEAMHVVELRKWAVRCEPDLTREVYARIDTSGAELCGCEECFNFATARHLLYSPDLLELFEWLGVDPLLEAHVWHDACLGAGRHAYTASFYLVGEIADGPATTVARHGAVDEWSLEDAGDGIRVGFSVGGGDAPEPFRGLPVVCLEVSVVAPWISNAPEPVAGP
jgi:hypothetical protein